ncbi:Putative ankyrin repeat protein RF_0381, partial [Araneus ventricosus]
MDSDSSNESPKLLKTLAFNVKYSEGNNLLHQFVLENSNPNDSGGGNYINAVLRSMSDASVNALNDEGYSALHLAVLKNNLLMVKKLLSCLENIDVNARSETGTSENTALHLAAKLGHIPIIQELLNKGADLDIKNEYDETALCLAATSGNLKMMKLLVGKGANVNRIGICGGPLYFAAKSNNFEAVKFLINSGAD